MKDNDHSEPKYHSRDQAGYDYSRSPNPSPRNLSVRRGGEGVWITVKLNWVNPVAMYPPHS